MDSFAPGVTRSVVLVTDDVWPLFAAYAITHSSAMEGVVIGAPLLAAGGFALGSLAATSRPAVGRLSIALGLVVFAVVDDV